MIFSLIQAQEDTVAAVDTLTKSYSQKWDAASNLQHANPVVKAASSHDLIFIVLGVTLIIWFVLLFFIIRVDKKLGKLENEIEQSKVKSAS